jgi:predicted transcriptional regulator
MSNETRPQWRLEAEEQGISLVELAKRTGISRRAIYAYSRGDRKPSPDWVARVGIVLDVVRGAHA